MTGKCQNCFDVKDMVPQLFDKDMKVTWKQWIKTENRMQQSTLSGTVQELLAELHDQTPKFKVHTYVKKQQSDTFEARKKETSESEILLQVDFAENFSILSQDEIQSAHWSHPQATIFTGCAWAVNGNAKLSYLLFSNELSHDKYAVWTFFKKIIEDLKQEYPTLKKVFMFSDGCAAQFKNRYTLSNICWSQEDWGVEIEWNLFATSHGKGAMDGVGATAKKMLWTAIMTRRCTINTCWECYDYLKSKQIKGMNILFISCDDIKFYKERLDERWTGVQPIPYIQKQHYFQALSSKSLAYSLTATSPQKKVLLCHDGKLNYNDVYSDSDTEQTTSQFVEVHTTSALNETILTSELMLNEIDTFPSPSFKEGVAMNVDDVEPTPGLSGVNQLSVNQAALRGSIKPGTFILVELNGIVSKKSKNYKYLAISQSTLDDEDDLKVMFMKSQTKNNNTFRIDENDVAYVNLTQILKVLPEPAIKTSGDRIYYEFDKRMY